MQNLSSAAVVIGASRVKHLYLLLFYMSPDQYNRTEHSLYSLETSAFEELGSEFINFASNCVINTLRLIVY